MASVAANPSSIKQSVFLSPSSFLSFQTSPFKGSQSFIQFKTPVDNKTSLSIRTVWCSQKSSVAHVINNDAPKKPTGNPIIVIDNYDSFTYNLCQYLGELGCKMEVYRNDELTVEELKKKNPRGILISPGPGEPQDSGISLQTVLELGPNVPLFGVCMGLQCIGEAFGGKIVRSPFGVMHGKSSLVYHNEGEEEGLLAGLSNPFTAGRYHSLVIDKESFPSDKLEITAWTEDGLIMAARHKIYKHLQGVQFHPESIITDEGKTIVRNFIKMIERKEAESEE
ncbi:anthranilate synthase beta subunit 2, chloroplastic-like [Coffea eugenioides]|uniref:anthranilate synthase n=1 Tax=Coffea arabica TaxID=13443 RepID=A0A6P6V5F0_COFAR|nr:anthranilate synthase beta subunit 2, chloroplastic-like [Coffea arabica]XP_027097129.1 anthranilate synthase beta subunit 2, chloroplastic-like [Coffea arabica]XP_027097130.1 anthranilate synthase beta subunit 2, chloroplastic-like [Coffea arabica]XP_027097131.1 anthranilate synthase beta subunit 2, chloroplastic-like [Coffea arabica]XP_027097132.1 anthranilate synthase beta subunit 2, chloroplastic-like [Coffea arabica]XP_027097133.1 anthranilate synthase beta subunit 2, chloroplastic-lik